MTPRTEQANPAVNSAKCLQALEDFLPIVEHRSGGIEAEVVVWLDAAVDPAPSGVIVLRNMWSVKTVPNLRVASSVFAFCEAVR